MVELLGIATGEDLVYRLFRYIFSVDYQQIDAF